MKKYFLTFIIILIITTLLPFNIVFADQGSTLSIKKVDSSKFPETIISFSVFDSNGLPIKNLGKNDIELKEKDKVVSDLTIASIIDNETPSYISLLIDSSGSMKGKPLEEAKEAAKAFIGSLKEIDEIKIFVFNDDVKIIQDFTKDKKALSNAIDEIEVEGTKTVLNLAAYRGLQDLESKPQGQRFLILLTDGKDEDISINADDAINLAKDKKIPIFSIGFGNNFNQESEKYDEEANKALNRFSILTGGLLFIAIEETDLNSSFNKVIDLLSYQYKLTYNSQMPKDGNDFDITISIKNVDEVVTGTIKSTSPKLNFKIDIKDLKDGEEIKEKINIIPDIKVEPSRFDAKNEIKKVSYYLDNDSFLLSESTAFPYSIEFDPSLYDIGNHNLLIKVTDNLGNTHDFSRNLKIVNPPKNNNLMIYLGIGLLVLIIGIILLIVLLKRKRDRKKIEEESLKVFKPGQAFGDAPSGFGFQTLNGSNDTIAGFDSEVSKETLIENKENFVEEDFGSKTVIRNIAEIKPNAWLVKTKGLHSGEEYSIPPEKSPDKRRITLGRSSYNDIVIDDEAASRENSFIIIEDREYKIGDMGSTNGTYLNDKKITSLKSLSDGDKIGIGDSELVFKIVTFENKAPKDDKSAINKNIKKDKKQRK